MIPETEKELIKRLLPSLPGVDIHVEKDGKIYELVEDESGAYVLRRVPDNSVKIY